MAKYNLNKIVDDVHKLYKKEGSKIGVGNTLKSLSDENGFIVMPQWWYTATKTKGIPFGAYIMIAGDSDSGKTSAAIVAMKVAQEQDCAVIYVETEGKTTINDLVSWGVDPNQIMLVKSSIVEEAFDNLFRLWDNFFKTYPDGKLLVVFDSIGNVISKHDMESEQSTTNQKPGGKGRSNRLALNKLIAKSREANVATFLVNYTYDNIGSPGKTNAGGKSLNLFSSLTYQTSRIGWIEQTVKGQKVRKGAKVQWKLFKNHIDKSNPGPKNVILDITADGISVASYDNE